MSKFLRGNKKQMCKLPSLLIIVHLQNNLALHSIIYPLQFGFKETSVLTNEHLQANVSIAICFFVCHLLSVFMIGSQRNR